MNPNSVVLERWFDKKSKLFKFRKPKIKMVKVRRPELGDHWCASHLQGFDLAAEFDGAEIGEKIEIELCEMTQEEIDAMPEFEGW